MRVLVINAGSSSIKFGLYDMAEKNLLVSGRVERIGEVKKSTVTYQDYTRVSEENGRKLARPVADYYGGIREIISFLNNIVPADTMTNLQAIGHRVVHGGENFTSPALINNEVIETMRSMLPLAPLHNPASLTVIEFMRQQYPLLPQVAVFDTAFFRTLPPYAYRYALPDNLYQQHHVRRYGFHGTSHRYVAEQAATYLQTPLEALKVITLHLGNGASAAAILNGVCIDTSMGMTPVEGLIMGTRCGDLDPSLPSFLARRLGLTLEEIENLLNRDSGLKGLCGVNDMREVHRLARDGDERASLAIDMYCYRLRKYIGAYYTALEGLDALIFTAGIGENDAVIRQRVCERLSVLGIHLDRERNQASSAQTFRISTHDGPVKVLVVPDNEELQIARETVSVIGKTINT